MISLMHPDGLFISVPTIAWLTEAREYIYCPHDFLLLAYSLMTVLVFCIVTATTEISFDLPIRGSSVAYHGYRFVLKSMGFTIGWMYYYIFATTVLLEITAAVLAIEYWDTPVNIASWFMLITVIIPELLRSLRTWRD